MNANRLIIDCISDTHNQHEKMALPGGDLLIHAGDISGYGRVDEVIRFLDWFAHQDYPHLVLIPGNHDFIFEKQFPWCLEECTKRKIILLNDSSAEIDGIKLWGSPIQPWFLDWAFNRQRGADIKKHWDLIPNDTEILVTHGPPRLILDNANARGYTNHVGCEDLFHKIAETKVKLHVFGHIHEGRGYKSIGGRMYINAASLDENYEFQPPGYIRVVQQGDDYEVDDGAN